MTWRYDDALAAWFGLQAEFLASDASASREWVIERMTTAWPSPVTCLVALERSLELTTSQQMRMVLRDVRDLFGFTPERILCAGVDLHATARRLQSRLADPEVALVECERLVVERGHRPTVLSGGTGTYEDRVDSAFSDWVGAIIVVLGQERRSAAQVPEFLRWNAKSLDPTID